MIQAFHRSDAKICQRIELPFLAMSVYFKAYYPFTDPVALMAKMGMQPILTVTFEFFTIRISDAFLSVYLTDLKLHRRKKNRPKLPPLGFELTTSGLSISTLPTELSHYLVVGVNH